MDSQDSRFTTPTPRIHGLYDINTPPSAQPHSPPFEIPESQQTTQTWDSRNGLRPVTEPLTPELLTHSQLLPDSLSQPFPPLFVLDSQAESSQAESSQELSQGPKRHYFRAPETSRDKRLQIQTALLFRIPHAEIKHVLDVTEHQITQAKLRLTPQKTRAGRLPTLHTPEKTQLKEWLLSSPSHRHVAYYKMPRHLSQLHAKERAFQTAVQDIGYCRRVSRKKGYSDDPEVYRERFDLMVESKD